MGLLTSGSSVVTTTESYMAGKSSLTKPCCGLAALTANGGVKQDEDRKHWEDGTESVNHP